MVDYVKPLVPATYALEGDGPLELDAYKHIQACSAFTQEQHPNLSAVAHDLAAGAAGVTEEELVQETIAKAKPAVTWFLRKFNIDLVTVVKGFKEARIFNPSIAQFMALTARKLQGLEVFLFVKDDNLQGLLQELPVYIAATDDIHIESADEIVTW